MKSMPINTDHDHAEFERQLQAHERELEQMARRLRLLEIEAGIYKPDVRRAS